MAWFWPGTLANPATLALHCSVAAALGEPVDDQPAGWVAVLDMCKQVSDHARRHDAGQSLLRSNVAKREADEDRRVVGSPSIGSGTPGSEQRAVATMAVEGWSGFGGNRVATNVRQPLRMEFGRPGCSLAEPLGFGANQMKEGWGSHGLWPWRSTSDA